MSEEFLHKLGWEGIKYRNNFQIEVTEWFVRIPPTLLDIYLFITVYYEGMEIFYMMKDFGTSVEWIALCDAILIVI